MIEVPAQVSSKAYQPSLPNDNGVNEMRWDVSRIYTALNIKVYYFFNVSRDRQIQYEIQLRNIELRNIFRKKWNGQMFLNFLW